MADYFVICSGGSERQLGAIGDGIAEQLRAEGVRPIGREGGSNSHWTLLDFGAVIVHIFAPPASATTTSWSATGPRRRRSCGFNNEAPTMPERCRHGVGGPFHGSRRPRVNAPTLDFVHFHDPKPRVANLLNSGEISHDRSTRRRKATAPRSHDRRLRQYPVGR